MKDRIYVKFSTADQNGQYTGSFAIAVKNVNWHGMTDEGMLWDIVHDDGADERILVRCQKYGDFKFGDCAERIVHIQIVVWDMTITKDEFHARVGKGRFMHPTRKHFVHENELPGLTIDT